jgi:hypothetical protein
MTTRDPVTDKLRRAVERIDRVCKTYTRDEMPGCVWETLVNVQATCELAVNELENGQAPSAGVQPTTPWPPHYAPVCPCSRCRGLRRQRDALNGEIVQDIREQDGRAFNMVEGNSSTCERLDGER